METLSIVAQCPFYWIIYYLGKTMALAIPMVLSAALPSDPLEVCFQGSFATTLVELAAAVEQRTALTDSFLF